MKTLSADEQLTGSASRCRAPRPSPSISDMNVLWGAFNAIKTAIKTRVLIIEHTFAPTYSIHDLHYDVNLKKTFTTIAAPLCHSVQTLLFSGVQYDRPKLFWTQKWCQNITIMASALLIRCMLWAAVTQRNERGAEKLNCGTYCSTCAIKKSSPQVKNHLKITAVGTTGYEELVTCRQN